MKVIATNLFVKNNKALKETNKIHKSGDELELSKERAEKLFSLGYVDYIKANENKQDAEISDKEPKKKTGSKSKK